MRERLAKIDGKRMVFTAFFHRYGEKKSFKGPPKRTLLFREVRDARTGRQMTDHIWFTDCKLWKQLDLRPGQNVQFEARVRPYWKGYAEERYRDFRLSHPSKASIQATEADLFAAIDGDLAHEPETT